MSANQQSDERTPLITGTSAHAAHSYHDDLDGAHAPTYLESAKSFVLGSWINLLLIAVPLAFVSHAAGWGSTADFVISFLAIVPLASLLGESTEQVAIKSGQTLGGLLNATFGNAVELIVSILALVRGELRIVQTSLLGSILSNLLLVLGCSFIAAGYTRKESTFQATAAQASSSLLVLATATLILPAAYHANEIQLDPPSGPTLLGAVGKTAEENLKGLLTLSRGTAVILLVCYVFYLFFQLKTHGYLFEDETAQEEEMPTMNAPSALVALVVVTVVTAFTADILVGAIDEFSVSWGIPKSFIGMILLPIVGNAAEHVTAVTMAYKQKMEIVTGVAVGSSIQIAAGVIPIVVILGWAVDRDMTLYFHSFETITLFISVFLVNSIIGDGKSNFLEGIMLISLYFVVGLAFWVS